MYQILREQIVKRAKQRHECNATLFLFAGMNLRELIGTIKPTFSEAKIIIKAHESPYIEKGESYLKQIGIYDGEFHVTKSRKAIHDICVKYALYFE